MNGSFGLGISRLLLLSTRAPTAELEFDSGLNVVTGPSDTGKSFAFQCIDFMLGAQRRPKAIREARAYDSAVLELNTTNGDVFCLERPLSGGKFKFFAGPWEAITPGHTYKELGEKHSAENQDTASYLLLSLCGLSDKVVRKNKNNQTRTLSFRDVVRLLLVDEQRIIAESSPVLSGQLILKTVEVSVFQLLLTGRDASGLSPIPDKLERKRFLLAKAEFVDELLTAFDANEELKEASLDELNVQIGKLSSAANEAEQELKAIGRGVDDLLAHRKELLQASREFRSRLLVIEELRSRFALLRSHYDSDLRRLDFIAEGHHYFTQLEQVVCPTCGQYLQGAEHAFCEKDTPEAESFQAACQAEARKIRALSADLENAVADLAKEEDDVRGAIKSVDDQLKDLESRLNETLRPRTQALSADLANASKTRERLTALADSIRQRDSLRHRRFEIYRDLDRLAKVKVETAESGDTPYDLLSQEFMKVLAEWQYPDLREVRFDETTMDFLINGEPRTSHGKGVRAVTHAAYLIALMRYCRERQLPHPGFVVLDSPLTTFRERDNQVIEEERDRLPADMQRAFFESLAAKESDQIIIFENKEPPPNVIEEINYVHFSGREDLGRPGLIPSSEPA